MDPCALSITAGCFKSAGNRVCEVLARGCRGRTVQPTKCCCKNMVLQRVSVNEILYAWEQVGFHALRVLAQ